MQLKFPSSDTNMGKLLQPESLRCTKVTIDFYLRVLAGWAHQSEVTLQNEHTFGWRKSNL